MKQKMTRRTFLVSSGAGLALIPSISATTQEDAPTLPPPKEATVLFDGTNLSQWLSRKNGPAGWKLKDGYMEVVPKSGDIYTKDAFGDFQLHLEFWLPYMPDAKGQARANSGVYLQGRYEVQVLDSYGLDPKDDDCGAIYKIAPPLLNACKKPERWQTYDIAFRAPRFDDAGRLKEKGRVTVFQNGILIHNHQELPGPTRASMYNDIAKRGPIQLQDHGNPIRYRSIWVIPSRNDS